MGNAVDSRLLMSSPLLIELTFFELLRPHTLPNESANQIPGVTSECCAAFCLAVFRAGNPARASTPWRVRSDDIPVRSIRARAIAAARRRGGKRASERARGGREGWGVITARAEHPRTAPEPYARRYGSP